MAGNKSDLINNAEVSKEEAQNFSNEIGSTLYYTSAITRDGIEEMFLNLVNKLLDLNNDKDKDNFPTVNQINETPNETNNITIEKPRKENNLESKDNNNELLKLKNLNKEFENKVISLKEELSKEKRINNELLNKIKNLENDKNDLVSNKDNTKVIELYEELRIKDKEIHELKKLNSRYPFELLEGEKLISVIFKLNEEKLYYSIICKNTDTFSKIEKLLYDEYPGYKNLDNNFFVNGNKINRFETLEENKIYNSDIITINPNNENNYN